MFWILTTDPQRGYSVVYSTPRDQAILAEVTRASRAFESLKSADLPERLTNPGRHLVPRQFVWNRAVGDPATVPLMIVREDRSVLYRFKPNMAASARFEKLGGGPGYLWGGGVGFFEYIIPARDDWRRVSQIIVRAHLQPVLPTDAQPQDIKTR